MHKIIIKAKKTCSLTKKEIIELLKSDSDELFKSADEIRKKFIGDEVYLRALIEFSNICKNNCHYCGLRLDNKNIERYKLSKEEILTLAQNAIGMGFRTIVLQSGESYSISVDQLAEIIREIKCSSPQPAVTLSVGE